VARVRSGEGIRPSDAARLANPGPDAYTGPSGVWSPVSHGGEISG
jgi:hypothetical protein